jgi:PAS domain S-box-containing protein
MAEEMSELMRAAIAHARDAVTITDANIELPGPTILYVNQSFTEMTGYASEEVIGKNPRFLQGPKTQQEVLSRLRQCLKAGKPFYGEAVNYRKDGSEFMMQWQISPIRDTDDKISNWVAIQRDVTQERCVEDELRRSQARFQSLMNTAPSYVLILDRNGTIQYVNQYDHGASEETTIGASAFDFAFPEFHGTLREAIEHTFDHGELTECELIVRLRMASSSAWALS